ncbi:flavin reductase family protein [Actinomadura sp. DC4]|uniref:flavin reductase family protein n=1 Tax=Actinomadura sp. DC4 TaxID=3055069 RepID=UPI0025B121B3|nr:flavin reductase family protein [Actinomadura sp. DC4]MDN3359036.1 flavin reductase family protein [Actinomadura sp. DC4]
MSVTTSPGKETGPSPQEMRRAMGAFASGVTVVAGIDGGEPVGFACQSFASVSLEPPLILFCADHRGRSWPRIRPAGRFNVSVLAEGQDEVCTRFGSGQGRKFEDLAWHASPWGTPVIEGVLLRVECVVHDVHVAGDHDVVIGRVLAVDAPGEEAQPMIFFRGGFGLGPAVAAPELWGWGDHWG